MVKRYWSLLFCLFSLGLFAENPLGMPEYSQILEVSFNTVEEAQKAELEKLELPDGRKIAFSTRWDDTNNRHLKWRRLVAARAGKGRFFGLNLRIKSGVQPLPRGF